MVEQKIQNVLDFVRSCKTLHYDGNRYCISETEKSTVTTYNIPHDEFGDLIQLDLKKYFFDHPIVYSDEQNFGIFPDDIKNNFLLFEKTGTFILFRSDLQSYHTYGSANVGLLNALQNTVAYFALFQFLSSKDFCDYFNDANNEIIVYSATNGVFKIKYKTIPIISFDDEIADKVKNLINLATSLEISPFFKNAIFTMGSGNISIEINTIISSANDIIAITKRDYELVSKKFDFEKIRDSLYKEKEKYFNNLRDVVSKIFAQAVGIPVSISATAFATYKVSDDIGMLVIIFFAFLAYTIFYLRLQFFYRGNIFVINNEFLVDFKEISNRSGLPSETIEKERKAIENSIRNTIVLINWLIGLVTFLGILMIWYIVYIISQYSLQEALGIN